MAQRILRLNRIKYYPQTTIGKLYLDGEYFGFTLEDTIRAYGIKVFKHTGIPANQGDGYKIGIRRSNSLNRDVLVIYTEGDKVTLSYGGISFKYIYFHKLSNHSHSHGCIGVAKYNMENVIHDSLEDILFDKVKEWLDNGDEVRLFIHNEHQQS